MMDEGILDALVETFESDGENGEEKSTRLLQTCEKSAFYKSAMDDQTWMHEVSDDEESTDVSSDADSEITPAEPLPKKKLSFSSIQTDLQDSFAVLPPTENPTENSPQVNDIEKEITTLKGRLEKLEEEKRRRQVENTAGKSAGPSSDKMHDCPIDIGKEQVSNKVQQRSSGANVPEISVRKRKSNESGLSVSKKARVAHPAANNEEAAILRAKAHGAVSKLDQPPRNQIQPNLLAYDEFFGIRIQDPKVAPLTFQNFVGIRQKIRISQMKMDTAVNWDDWVTMGVVVDKTPLKTSALGNQFSIWKLSDLLNCQCVIRLLLFGESAKAFWKVKKGDVVGLLNASKMENKTGSFPAEKTCVVTVKVDRKHQIVELGSCPDYGVCKGMRKQDNLNCTNFVNRSKSDYCDFHLVAGSKRLASNRGEFQSSSNIPPKKFNNPVRKVLAGSTNRTATLARPTLASMQRANTKDQAGDVVGQQEMGKSAKEERNAQLLEAMDSNTIGSRQLLSQLARNCGGEKSEATFGKKESSLAGGKLTCRQFLADQRKPTVGAHRRQTGVSPSDAAKAKAVAILRKRNLAGKGVETKVAKTKATTSKIQ